MKTLQIKQRGFGFVGLLLVLVVIGAIVFIGAKVMDMRNAKTIVSSDVVTAPSTVPVKISSKAELQSAATTLEATNVNSVDLTQLDSDLSALL